MPRVLSPATHRGVARAVFALEPMMTTLLVTLVPARAARWAVAALACAGLAFGTGCGDDASGGAVGTDTGSDDASGGRGDAGDLDAGGTDAGGTDAGDASVDAGAALDPACWDDAASLGVFALEGETTQIHPDVAWDGEAVWVTWNVANDASDFAVRVGRLGCEGQWLVEPFDVSPDAPGNRIDPAIAVRDGRVLVVWQNDDGAGENNLSIEYRTFGVDGADPGPDAAPLELVVDGETVVANAWMADVTATSDGFMLAGAWADPTTSTFQVFTQAFDADAAPFGELRRLVPDANETQVEPAIAVTDGGEITVAWAEQFRDDGDRVRIARWIPANDDGVTVEVIDGGVAADATGGTAGLVAASTVDGITYVRPNGGETQALQGPPGVAISPVLAARGDATFIGWLQPIRGFTNDAFGGWLDGASVDASALSADPVAAYPLTATPVGERSVLIAWAAGDTSPLFTMQAIVVSQ